MADVERGTWRPTEPSPTPEIDVDPGFHQFASEWFERRRGELAPRTQDDYRWRLTDHLLPFFAGHRLSQITVQEVDRYRQAKVREVRLSADSINKTLTLLAAVLKDAVEYELIARNPAKGKRRRLKAPKPRAVHLDSAEQLVALLDAARELDRRRESRTTGRYPLVATLVFAGLRPSEAGNALVRDLNLARGRLDVTRSKTEAGLRSVDLLPILRDVLRA